METIRQINFEKNPNLTFWQYLRATGQPEKVQFDGFLNHLKQPRDQGTPSSQRAIQNGVGGYSGIYQPPQQYKPILDSQRGLDSGRKPNVSPLNYNYYQNGQIYDSSQRGPKGQIYDSNPSYNRQGDNNRGKQGSLNPRSHLAHQNNGYDRNGENQPNINPLSFYRKDGSPRKDYNHPGDSNNPQEGLDVVEFASPFRRTKDRERHVYAVGKPPIQLPIPNDSGDYTERIRDTPKFADNQRSKTPIIQNSRFKNNLFGGTNSPQKIPNLLNSGHGNPATPRDSQAGDPYQGKPNISINPEYAKKSNLLSSRPNGAPKGGIPIPRKSVVTRLRDKSAPSAPYSHWSPRTQRPVKRVQNPNQAPSQYSQRPQSPLNQPSSHRNHPSSNNPYQPTVTTTVFTYPVNNTPGLRRMTGQTGKIPLLKQVVTFQPRQSPISPRLRTQNQLSPKQQGGLNHPNVPKRRPSPHSPYQQPPKRKNIINPLKQSPFPQSQRNRPNPQPEGYSSPVSIRRINIGSTSSKKKPLPFTEGANDYSYPHQPPQLVQPFNQQPGHPGAHQGADGRLPSRQGTERDGDDRSSNLKKSFNPESLYDPDNVSQTNYETPIGPSRVELDRTVSSPGRNQRGKNQDKRGQPDREKPIKYSKK